MKKTVFLVFVLMDLCFWAQAGASNNENRPIKVIQDLSHNSGKLGAYHALIIGINDYEDENIPDLETPLKDALALDKVLREKYGFKTQLLLGRKATREAIDNTLRKLVTASKSNDNVLIYYAGHGDLDRTYNDGWWVPADARGGKPTTYLDNTVVQKAMRSMNVRHVLLISDSCYSGTLFGRARALVPVSTNDYYLSLYNERSRWGMTSGNREPVSDTGTDGHSVFAYQLLKVLKKNTNPYLTTQEIFKQIAPIVSNNSAQTPRCRPIRNTGDQGGEFVFVVSNTRAVSKTTGSENEQASLSVEANVDGASVTVDGQVVGTTNLENVSVSPGEHLIRVEKDEYEPYTKTVHFRSERSMSLSVHLEKAQPKSGLYVDTQPTDAQVRILNITSKFFQGIELSPGRYHLEVSAHGFVTEKKWITLAAGEDTNISLQLKAASSARKIRTLTNSIGMAFVYVGPGTFKMGSPTNETGRDDDETQHRVTLTKGFYIQNTEVTQGQWVAVMGTRPWAGKNYVRDDPNCPAVYISWDECQEFIRRLNEWEGFKKHRLPYEAEWEYACRAGAFTNFCFGNSTSQLGEYAWYRENALNTAEKCARRVGTAKANAWGVYDMHGNVWEWCQDWRGEYPASPVTNPKGPSSGSERVLRGGSWAGGEATCRSANRRYSFPDDKGSGVGFRLARRAGRPY